MSKIRVYDLAKEADMKSTELAEKLIDLGYNIKGHSSTVEDEVADEIRRNVLGTVETEVVEKRISTKGRATIIRRRSQTIHRVSETPSSAEEEVAAAAATVDQCLYTLDDNHFLVGFQRGPACRWIHSIRAAAMNIGAIKQNIQPGLSLSTDNRVNATSAKTATRNAINLAQELTTICTGRTYLVVFIRYRKIGINAYSVFEYIVDDNWIKLKRTS